MEDGEKSGGGKKRLPIEGIVAFILLAPLIYILSIVPAIILFKRFPSLETPLEAFYSPLEWLVENFAAMNLFFKWYLDLVEKML